MDQPLNSVTITPIHTFTIGLWREHCYLIPPVCKNVPPLYIWLSIPVQMDVMVVMEGNRWKIDEASQEGSTRFHHLASMGWLANGRKQFSFSDNFPLRWLRRSTKVWSLACYRQISRALVSSSILRNSINVYTSTQRPGMSLHMISFTRLSPMLVLRAAKCWGEKAWVWG